MHFHRLLRAGLVLLLVTAPAGRLFAFADAQQLPTTPVVNAAETTAANGQLVPPSQPVVPGVTRTRTAAAGTAAQADGNARRPVVLIPLYASFSALEMADANSTLRCLSRGGYELNPAMNAIVSNRAVFFSVKAGVTASTIVASERLWKRNRRAAIALMVGVNCAYAIIVARNFRIEAAH